ncbi:MAG: UDP-2,3-diacylglucosamine diphosphatase LpxI [Candidatus Omnitrophota bacterium]
MKKIGLIAGNRKLPLLFCAGAKAKGYSVVVIAIKGDTALKIKKLADKVYWLKLSEFRRLFEIFESEGVKQVVMAGQISPARLFSKEVAQSEDIQQILLNMKNKKADSIFGAIADKLAAGGLELLGATTFMEGLLAAKGTLTQSEPDSQTWQDIFFGFELAKSVGALDIGQTVAIKDKAIIAVEALEGTDNLIRRAGRLVRSGITVVKVAKPKQDMRFDIPVVGLKTVQNLVKAGAKCLAIEADKTFFIDRQAAAR